VAAIAAAAMTAGPRNTNPPSGKIVTVTINSDVGLQSITVTNQNTASSWLVLLTELPYSFNCTANDMLTFNATAKTGYKFNAWLPNSGIPYSSNPYALRVAVSFSLVAKFTPIVSPT
jgi:hypothetical protein